MRVTPASRFPRATSSKKRVAPVQRVGVVLRVVAGLDAVADLIVRADRQLARDHAQQRGLAGAVDADDADLLAALDA